MITLSFENAALEINNTALLHPMNLSLNLKGIVCVLGYNGAGKSLFLELCHGMLSPSIGHVLWNNTPAIENKNTRGFIFQHRLVVRRCVAQNIALPMQALKWSHTDINHRLEELLDMVDLKEKANDPAVALSGGEAQRMALARALACRPKVLIMDEPTSSLDPIACSNFEKLITTIAATGVKFIWATHKIEQARRFADQIIFVNNGYVSIHNLAKDFFNDPPTAAAEHYIKDR